MKIEWTFIRRIEYLSPIIRAHVRYRDGSQSYAALFTDERSIAWIEEWLPRLIEDFERRGKNAR